MTLTLPRTTKHLATAGLWALCGCLTIACDPQNDDPMTSATTVGAGDPGSTGDNDPPDPSDPTSPEATTTTGSTVPPSDTDEATTDADTDDTNFVVDPDVPGTAECDVWAQDCPEGEKCMPWANDGGVAWNAARCAPVAATPASPGDPCTAEGGGLSGIDDCDDTSMCWNLDPETNQGTCAAFCEGSAQSYACSDPNAECTISHDGILILCLPTCDPLGQDCPEGQACYQGVQSGFQCYPNVSGETGGYGDPCEYTNVCDEGLFCSPAYTVPGCNSNLCCNDFCDLDADDPAAGCSGAADGQMCIPWYEEGSAPPGQESIGYCSPPQ